MFVYLFLPKPQRIPSTYLLPADNVRLDGYGLGGRTRVRYAHLHTQALLVAFGAQRGLLAAVPHAVRERLDKFLPSAFASSFSSSHLTYPPSHTALPWVPFGPPLPAVTQCEPDGDVVLDAPPPAWV